MALSRISKEMADCHIYGVAMKLDNLVFWLPRPARHHDLIAAMAAAGVKTPIGHGGYVQGFQTLDGFSDRTEAAHIVGYDKQLYSEDLW